MSMRWSTLLLLAACSSAAQAPPEPAHRPSAPVLLSVEVVSGEPVAGGRLELRAHLEHQGPWPYPIAVEWQLPAGVLLVSGSPASVVAPGEPSVVAVDLARVPAEDLVVTASSRGPNAGFHAKASYRFGRPEPAPRQGPEKTGPSTEVNGHDLGPSVPMN